MTPLSNPTEYGYEYYAKENNMNEEQAIKSEYKGTISAYAGEMLIDRESIYGNNETRAEEVLYRRVMNWKVRSGYTKDIEVDIEIGDTTIIWRGQASSSLTKAKQYIASALIK